MSKKSKIILIVGIIVTNVLITGGIVFLLLSGFKAKYEITTDLSQYNEVITGEKWGLSEEIFPEDPGNADVADFKHVYSDPWDANYLAYLVADFGPEEYKEETERLNRLGIDEYTGYYGVTGFTNYELLAMEADSYHGFVYAVTDGKSRIIYVELIFCNYFMDISYEAQIPAEYLPDGFDAGQDNPYRESILSITETDRIDETADIDPTAAQETLQEAGTMEIDDAYIEKGLAEYEAMYNIIATYPDELMPFCFVLLSDDDIHLVTILEELSQATIIPMDKIAHIDKTDLGELVSITITDTAGEKQTCTLSAENAEEFTEMIADNK